MSDFEKTFESVIDEIPDISQTYPNLHFVNEDDNLVLKGNLFFRASYGDKVIEDSYDVSILFSSEYPSELPVVRDIGNRIASDYHTNPDGTLCLGVYSMVCMKFYENPSILTFIEELLIPYLYRHSYLEQYKKEPWGERAHGDKGVYEFYLDYFGIKNIRTVLSLLDLIVTKKYKGHKRCLCGSGLILRKCHGKKLLNLLKVPKKYLHQDILYILRYLKNGT
jgi:hypothetical protein